MDGSMDTTSSHSDGGASTDPTAQFATPDLSSQGSLALLRRPATSSSDDLAERPSKCSKLAAGSSTGRRELHPNVALTPPQHKALGRVLDRLDVDSTSVIITNPLQRDNPIVFVTKPWEEMCGFTYSQAVGKNPRITQGQHSDPAAVQLMASALRSQRSCKAMLLNYRGGLEAQPFWNMLTINPILHNGKLALYLANLQDYTYHMSKLVTLPPSQFCRSAEYHQQTMHIPDRPGDHLHLRFFARPALIETCDEAPTSLIARPPEAPPHATVKSLGWSSLVVEPEHITDRVVDALHTMEARYERVDRSNGEGDVFTVFVELNGVAMRMSVMPDSDSSFGFRLMCTRLGGDTFAYHEAFRQLKQLLGEVVQGGTSLRSQLGLAGGSGGMMFAPGPSLPPA